MKLQSFGIPEPSKLYSLKPEGLGTPQTESLASYAMRLAVAHSLHVCDLIQFFIHPLTGNDWKDVPARRGFNKFYKVYKHRVTPAHLHAGKWLDMTQETRATVKALSTLTKRQNLDTLTLLPLRDYVQQKTALRYQRAWCPCCYEEQRDTGKPIHDLLLWSFIDVSKCPRHEQILWSGCPWCGARQYPLHYRSQPGHCSKCGLWLGKKPKYTVRSADFDMWKAKAIGNLVANFNNLPKQKPKRRPSIQRLLSRHYKTGGSIEDLLINLS